MTTNLYRVINPVKDIEIATRFYAEVFDISGERISPGRHYFDCEGTILACYDPRADGDDEGGGWRHHTNQYLYFAVDDLDAQILRHVQRETGDERTHAVRHRQ